MKEIGINEERDFQEDYGCIVGRDDSQQRNFQRKDY